MGFMNLIPEVLPKRAKQFAEKLPLRVARFPPAAKAVLILPDLWHEWNSCPSRLWNSEVFQQTVKPASFLDLGGAAGKPRPFKTTYETSSDYPI
jgi:hypothetical protein